MAIGWLFSYAAQSKRTGLFAQERYWYVHSCEWQRKTGGLTAPRNVEARTRALAHASRRGDPIALDVYAYGPSSEFGDGNERTHRPARGLPRGKDGRPITLGRGLAGLVVGHPAFSASH